MVEAILFIMFGLPITLLIWFTVIALAMTVFSLARDEIYHWRNRR